MTRHFNCMVTCLYVVMAMDMTHLLDRLIGHAAEAPAVLVPTGTDDNKKCNLLPK